MSLYAVLSRKLFDSGVVFDLASIHSFIQKKKKSKNTIFFLFYLEVIK